jgi:uncharacterized protein YdeI (YjbR/CyaY-like superfamily)
MHSTPSALSAGHAIVEELRMNTDPRVDAYIAKSAAFAQPILAHLRAAMHAALPEAKETIKWGMPFFEHAGRPLANMAAFKQHCAFGFWQGEQVAGAGTNKEAMGQFGRVTVLSDLPSAPEFKRLVQKAAALIDAGVKPRHAPKTADTKAPPELPAVLATAWKRKAAARRGFAALAPGQQREYIEWITEAKRDDTRARRVAQAIEWLAEGKSKNWKYERC